MSKFQLTFGLTLFLISNWVMINPADCQERATMRYRELLNIAQGTRENDTSTKFYEAKIASNQEGVAPQKIEMFLETRKGPKFLFVDNEGIIKVPSSTTLFVENPLLITNQPKGTLTISSDFTVSAFVPPKVIAGKISYKDLFKPILDSNAEIRRVDGDFGTQGKEEFILLIKTDQPIRITRQTVDKNSKSSLTGSRTYKPHKGFIALAFDDFMYQGSIKPIVEIPGEATFTRKMVKPEVAKQIRDSYYDQPDPNKAPLIIGGNRPTPTKAGKGK